LPSARSASGPCRPWRRFVYRHWPREREGAIFTGPTGAEAARPAVELVPLARGENTTGSAAPRVSATSDLATLSARCSTLHALPRLPLTGWTHRNEQASGAAISSSRRYALLLPSDLPDCVADDSACRDRQHDRSSRRTHNSLSHSPAAQPALAADKSRRPGCAGALALAAEARYVGQTRTLSEFLFVRDRDRRVLDDRWNLRREGLLVGALRSVGLAEREKRFRALQSVASLRLPPLVSRTRGRHFHRPKWCRGCASGC